MKRIALFPGSFDPFTCGHEDIVLRGIKMFDSIIIAIGYNLKKESRYFDIEYTVEKIKETFVDFPQIQVMSYAKLTAELAYSYKANYILRGLRNTTDFEYENSISQVNSYLNKDLETIFLITSPKFASFNSSIIREVHKYGGDISHFIPYKL